MAKPAITKRNTKAAALTYSELDTNFQNLADATLTLRAGTGGTNVTADLNGTITLVAGTNVTLTGDNSAKTITVNSTGGSSTWVGTATSDLNMNGFTIKSGGGGNILVDDDINFPSGTGPNVSSGGQLLCRGGTITLQVTNNPGLEISGATLGTPSNTSTPGTYLRIYINGGFYFIPLYQ
jgi:hypothetical protein